MARGKKLTILLLMLTFGVGYFAGILSGPTLATSTTPRIEAAKPVKSRSRKEECGRREKHSRRRRAGFIEHLSKKLALNGEQGAKLEDIVGASLKKYEELRREMGPRFKQIHQETRAEIRTILTAEQLPKFEAWTKEMDERRAKWAARRKSSRSSSESAQADDKTEKGEPQKEDAQK